MSATPGGGARAGARRLAGDRSGAAAIEFAIGALLILFLCIGVFEVGVLFLDQRALDNATVVTARWAAVNSSTDTAANLRQRFVGALAPAIGSTAAQACSTELSQPTGAGCVLGITFATSAVGGQPTLQPVKGGTVTISTQLGWSEMTTLLGMAPLTLTSNATLSIMQ